MSFALSSFKCHAYVKSSTPFLFEIVNLKQQIEYPRFSQFEVR